MKDNPEYLGFTSGFDRYVWVPYCWGLPDPSLPWTYIFALGFEGHRSLAVYDRFQPDKVKALIGRPSVSAEYDGLAERQNQSFLKDTSAEISYANAADATAAWKAIEEAISSERQSSNICLVPLGTKPHGIACGLASLSDGAPGVLYHMPRSYRVRDVTAGEYSWLFRVTV